MSIDIKKIGYQFKNKPLLIGGKAMEHYGLRESKNDVDLLVTLEDYQGLAEKYPEYKKEIYGDMGVCFEEFEIWKSICLFDYNFYSVNCIEEKDYSIISLEKLLFMKSLFFDKEKSQRDIPLIVKKILDEKYKDFKL